MPDLPNPHAIAAMLLTAVALGLFSSRRIRLEISSFGLIAILVIGFSLFPYEGFEPASFYLGFGHEALIGVCALMVIGQGLVSTGALEPFGRFIGRHWGRVPFASLIAMLVLAAVLSAFINNTPIVVLFLPILVSVSLRTDLSPAKVLMPMGFATLLGGMTTTIGTSTNLLVVAVAADLGQPRLGMFDFALPAAIAGAVGILYLCLVAPRLLKAREIQLENVSPRVFEARLQLSERSPVIGGTLSEAIAETGGRMKVTRIRRGKTFLMPLPDVELRAGDRLRVTDTPQNLKAYEEALNASLYSGETQVDEDHPLSADSQTLAEIAVVPGSTLDRANLRYVRFVDRYQLYVLALHRHGRDIWHPRDEIEDVILQAGDILLVQGPREQIAAAKRSTDLLVLDATTDLPSTHRAKLALVILAGVVACSASGLLPIAASAVGGVTLMILTRCLNIGTAVRAVPPAIFFVVVASLALGRALSETGATDFLSELLLYAAADAPQYVIVGALMLFLALLTNIVSNNAAAVIGTPIAVSVATQLGVTPEPFVLAVLFGANMSFATPMAYQTNLLVMSAGRYEFSEFVKVGVPLILLLWITLTWVLTLLYL